MHHHPHTPRSPNITPTSYSTTDLYIAAFLQANGAKLVEVTRDDRRSILTFSDPDFCLEYARRFQTGDDDEISASRYAAEVKRIKNLALKGGF